MHAGLLRPDGEDAPAIGEAAKVAHELMELPDGGAAKAPVALVFDYPSSWAWEALPQGADFTYFGLVFDTYKALRRAGLSVDIVPSDVTTLDAYKLVFVPGLLALSGSLRAALANFEGTAVLGPRTNSKTDEFTITTPLPPNLEGLDCTVTRVESLPPFSTVALQNDGGFQRWFEHLEGDADVTLSTKDGRPAMMSAVKTHYLAGWLDEAGFDALLADLCAAAESIESLSLPEGLRVRDTESHRFVFNYGPDPAPYNDQMIAPAGVYWHEL